MIASWRRQVVAVPLPRSIAEPSRAEIFSHKHRLILGTPARLSDVKLAESVPDSGQIEPGSLSESGDSPSSECPTFGYTQTCLVSQEDVIGATHALM